MRGRETFVSCRTCVWHEEHELERTARTFVELEAGRGRSGGGGCCPQISIQVAVVAVIRAGDGIRRVACRRRRRRLARTEMLMPMEAHHYLVAQASDARRTVAIELGVRQVGYLSG